MSALWRGNMFCGGYIKSLQPCFAVMVGVGMGLAGWGLGWEGFECFVYASLGKGSSGHGSVDEDKRHRELANRKYTSLSQFCRRYMFLHFSS